MSIEIILVTLILLLLLLLHYLAGRVKTFEISFLKPNDTYESINYRQEGRVNGPYYVWPEGDSELEMQFEVRIKYASPYYIGKRFGENLALTALAKQLPDFVNNDIYIKAPNGKMFAHNLPLKTTVFPVGDEHPAFKFWVKLEKSLFAEIAHPQMLRFSVEYYFSGKRFFFFRERKSGRATYTVFVGPDIGGQWLAIDLGTTATCIAAGSHADNITLQPADARFQEGETDSIVPSMLRIKSEYEYTKGQSLLKLGEEGVLVGHEVRDTSGENVQIFQSIKKLLGYSDIRTASFNNGETLQLNGADLTALLVQGVTRDFKKYIVGHSHQYKDLTDRTGAFLPKRLIVAIPNNFTATKIQDLVDCMSRFEQFKEIRCISESEAVLCYYVHQYQKLNKDKGSLEDETVMVFDMGGATINLTVGDAYVTNNGRRRYHIDIDGKMGYGIGGDTIDYCLARLFFEHLDEYPELEPFNPFKDINNLPPPERQKQKIMRMRVKKVVEKIKLQIIKNVKTYNRKELIKPFDIQDSFNKEFSEEGLDLFINQESRLFSTYFSGGGLKLLSYRLFKELVFQPIEDAIEELAKVTNLHILNTVILSGRSTLFPGVLAAVEQKIKKLTPSDRVIRTITLDKEHAKTAVVRGACWFAANRNAVELSRHKISSQFGIRRRVGAGQDEVEFLKLIGMGAEMSNEKIAGTANIKDNFALDNQQVHFYQVMCADARQAFIKGQKHKYSQIGILEAKFEVQEVGMEIWYDDTVKGHIRMSNGESLPLGKETTLKDLEIADANDEHYTWIAN